MMRLYSSEHFHENYRSLVLPGGFEIIHYHKPFSLQAAFLSVDYGSLHRSYRGSDGIVIEHPMGIAHFLEHKLFESAGDAFNARMAKLGVSVNAYTSYERTCFYFFGGAHFQEALEELLCLVANAHFTSAGVEKEKPIIAREIDLYEDDLDALAYRKGLEALYPGHRVTEEILGTKESVESITREMLEQVMRDAYSPSRMQLLLVGDFGEGLIEKIAMKLPRFYTLARPAMTPIFTSAKPPAMRKVRTEKDVSLPSFAYFRKLPVIQGEKERGIERLRRALALEAAAGEGSPLYTEQYEKGNILSLQTQTIDLPGVSFFCISGEGRRPKAFTRSLEDSLEKASKVGIGPSDLERIRRRRIGERLRAFDNYSDLAFRYFELRSRGMNLFDEAELLYSLPAQPIKLPLGERVLSLVGKRKK